MVISRESPRAKVSPDKNNANWPPKSPYEALLSSPSGRKVWQDHRDGDRDREPSPSPRGKFVTTSKALAALQDMSEDEETDEEDEETLRLQLQAIEAKLKLKKLQNKRKQATANDHDQDQDDGADGPSSSSLASPRKRLKTSFLPGVQIPVSPIKDRMPPPELSKQHTSPARVLLGIDKGLKAKDVSLKRPRPATSTSRPDSASDATPKPSFSERIAASRLSKEQQEAKQERIQLSRTKGFALPSSSSAASLGTPLGTPISQRQPVTARNLPANPVSRPSQTAAAASVATTQSPFVSRPSTRSTPASSLPVSERYSVIDGDDEGKTTEPSEDGSSFESYSSLHLSRRNIPHIDLVRSLDDKQIYTLPRLLKEVKAPHYDPPDCESDFVVFAVIASKSTPHETKPQNRMNSSTEPDIQDEIRPKNKFMAMTLTDLKWELDLFLFGTAFTQFWKMTPGTLIAILNPGIYPPKTNQHNGRFSLKLSSSEDSILEIGNARDLGFCKSIKKDGKQCGSWVNKRKTQFCDYHVELAVEKTRKSRMEVNAMYRPNNAATGGNRPFKQNSRALGNGEFNRKNSSLTRDHDSGSQYFMGGKGGLSAATLLDAEDLGKADAMRKRLKEKEKERILGEKLGRLGNGMGAEYLRSTTADANKKADQSSSSSSSSLAKQRHGREDSNNTTAELDADALGLLSKRAADVDLRPVAGSKRAFHASATSSAGTEALGWGGSGKWGLLLPKKDALPPHPRAPSPEKGQTKLLQGIMQKRNEREESPRKRARFDLVGKGLREPGRESLGGGGGGGGGEVKRDAKGRIIVERAPDSSDDDLDIV